MIISGTVLKYTQGTSAVFSTANPNSVTFKKNVAKNDLIVVVVTYGGGSATTKSVTDNKGNTYTKAVDAGSCAIWFGIAVTGGSNFTVTATSAGSASFVAVGVLGYTYPPGSAITCEQFKTGKTPSPSAAVSLLPIPVTGPDLVVMVATGGGAFTPGTGWNARISPTPGIAYQDFLNPQTSPVPSTLTLPTATFWNAASAAFLIAVPKLELDGPFSTKSGSPAAFTLAVTDGIPLTDTFTFDDENYGGAFVPKTLSLASALSGGFSYTATTPGIPNITVKSTGGNTIGSIPWPLGIYQPFTVTGPTSCLFGVPSGLFTVTPAGKTSDIVTFDDGNQGGTFTPPSLSWNNSSDAQTYSYTSASSGPVALTLASTNGATFTGSPYNILSAAVVAPAQVTKSGTMAMMVATSSHITHNDVYDLAPITAVNATPTFKVNSASVNSSPPIWVSDPGTKPSPCVGFELNCGSVRNIGMANGGDGYSTTPTAVWNGDGGGTGLKIGAPTTQQGITSYTIKIAGSGLKNGTFLWSPLTKGFATQRGVACLAAVTVEGGVVTKVVPACGSSLAYGSYGAVPVADPFWPAGNGVGSPCTIVLNRGTYVTGIPVLDGGKGFTSIPTFTITDPTGKGAVAAAIMTGPSATDTVTYSVGDGWLTTTLGSTAGGTDLSIVNSVGKLEPQNGTISGMAIPPTMPFGTNSPPGSNPDFTVLQCRANKWWNNSGWSRSTGSTSLKLDANFFPTNWTPGGSITAGLRFSNAVWSAALPFGTWTLVYPDHTPDGQTTTVLLTSDASQTLSAPLTTTKVGNIVTQTYTLTPFSSTNQQCQLRLNFSLKVTSSDGNWYLGDATGGNNIGLFPPGVTPDIDDIFAIDDTWVRNFTGPAGTVPAHQRWMVAFGGNAFNNEVDPSDIPSNAMASALPPYLGAPGFVVPTTTPNSVGGYPSGTVTWQFARHLNTDASDSTYGWNTTKIYSSQPWAASGGDTFGTFLDMTAGPNGVKDNGQMFRLGTGAGQTSGVVELRTTDNGGKHGLKTGQVLSFKNKVTLNMTQAGNVPFPVDTAMPLNVYVTGPDTIAVPWSVGVAATTFATMTSKTEVPINIVSTLACPYVNPIPLEVAARFTSKYPSMDFWFACSPIASDAYVTECMNRIIPNLGPTNGFLFEWGNEPWNFGGSGFEFMFESTIYKWTQHLPSTTTFMNYFTGGTVTGFSGPSWNVAASANGATVALKAWTAAGRSEATFTRTYGGQWTNTGISSAIASMINKYKLPPGLFAVAPYIDFPLKQTAITKAFSPAGDVINSQAGGAPVEVILDYLRFWTFYNPQIWTWYSGESGPHPAGCFTATYEGTVQTLLDVNSITLGNWIEEDMVNHQAWRDFIYCFTLSQQIGNPQVPGSNVVLGTFFGGYSNINATSGRSLQNVPGGKNDCIGGEGTIWRLAQSPYQPTGLGIGNSFLTPQGGELGTDASRPYGYSSQTQEAPGIQALVDWNAAMGTPAVIAISPSDGTKDVAAVVTPTVQFTMAMNPATINATNIKLIKGGVIVASTVSYDEKSRTATITPSAPLINSAVHVLMVSRECQSSNGASLAQPSVVNFTTEAVKLPASILSLVPGIDQVEVDTDPVIEIQFSDSMNPATLNESTIMLYSLGNPVDGVVSYDAPTNTAIFTPAAVLNENALYTGIVTRGVTTAQGTPIISLFNWTFLTKSSVPVALPASMPSQAPSALLAGLESMSANG